MSSITTDRRGEVARIFGRVLPLIDSALLYHYSLPRAAADEMEMCLQEWFHSFVRRPGSPQTLDGLRPHLLAMACNAGHVYWSARPSEEIAADERVRRSLSLGPQRVAIELGKAAEERDKRGGEPEKGEKT